MTLEQDRVEEAQRRLRMLGKCIQSNKIEDSHLYGQAEETYIPLPVLTNWWKAYKQKGLKGLEPPNWEELSPVEQEEMIQRYGLISPMADSVTLTVNDVQALAKARGWSERTAERWLQRYRVGGKYGLSARFDPMKRRHVEKPPRDLGPLDDKALETVYQRLEWIKPLLSKQSATNEEVEVRSKELKSQGFKVSPRSLRDYLSRYKRYGIAGLADKQRSDAGELHNISNRMKSIIIGLRLSQKDMPIDEVHKQAEMRALALGEAVPSPWQVRSICEGIPKSDTVLADGRIKKDNNWVITFPIHLPKGEIVYMTDTTLVDNLVKDMRKGKVDKDGKPLEVRPYLTTVIEGASRALMARLFSYDRPDRHVIAAVLRDAMLTSEKKNYGGAPDEIWVDNGKEFISNHIRQLCRELDINLNILHPHSPQIKGRVERFFGTLNTRLWSRLPGYVGSNTVVRNPTAKAELTLKELVEHFDKFIDEYHHEKHSQTGETPLDYFSAHCFTLPVDPRRLDVLLKEPRSAKVTKMGVKHLGKYYWHPSFATLVGKRVTIRTAPAYDQPDEIEVFSEGYWICTAYYTESEQGLATTRETVRAAKKEQKRAARERIRESRLALQDADQEIQTMQPQGTQSHKGAPSDPENPSGVDHSPKPGQKPKPGPTATRLSDIFTGS